MSSTPGKGNKGGKFTRGRVDVKRLMGKKANVPIEFSQSEESLEKDAAFFDSIVNRAASALGPTMTNGFQRGAGMALGGAAVGLGLSGLGMLKNKVIDSPRYEQALQQAIMISPTLRHYDLNILREYLSMIVKASPTVASDPRLLANYLESLLDAEGHINLGTFKELASLENTLLTNREMRDNGISDIRSGLTKGIAKSLGEILVSRNKNNP